MSKSETTNGNLTQFVDRKGQASQFTFDELNRRTHAGYADGSFTHFTYDSVGRLKQINDSISGYIQMGYDDLDRLEVEITPQGAVNYSYDAIGRRTSMAYNGLPPVTYGYDNASRLTQVAQGAQTVGLGYDTAGRRTSLTYPNGTNTSYFYDDASKVTEIFHNGPSGPIEDLFYTYDSAGNRISFSRTGPQADLPAPITAAHNAANQLVQFNADSLTYDLNGNLTFDGTTTYTWDARNRLIAMSGPNGSASFAYDGLGRRVSKTINGTMSEYQYDGNDIVAEIGGDAIGATYLRSLNIDEPFIRQGSNEEYYHADALGSILALSDQTGAAQTTYSYEAFGKTTITGTSTNPFQYTGRENDNTGLNYYRARYYKPIFQRFINEDPLQLGSGSINFYSYVANNPIFYIDRFGLERGDPWDLRTYYLDIAKARQIGVEERRSHPGHNNEEDAIRHAEWSRRMYTEINPISAWTVANLYEFSEVFGEPWGELLMDLHNNAEGRNAGREQRSIDRNNLITHPYDDPFDYFSYYDQNKYTELCLITCSNHKMYGRK